MAALQPVLLVVCAIGIIVGIAVPVVWLFRPETVHRKAPPLPMAFRLVLIEVMFALTAIMAILFGIDSQLSEKVSFEFRVGGPFAAFLGSTLLILFFGNKDDVKQAALAQQIVGAVQDQLPGQLVAAIKDRVSEELVPLVQGDMCEELAKAIEKAETASEWQSYEKFKEGLNGFEEINAKEEEYFVRNLLGAGYSPSEQVQVETATITTAFLYLGDQPEKGSVVKLQRVCGKTLSKTKPAKVRFRSFSSYGTRGLRSVILISETSAPPTILKSDCDADVTGR
jgi:hypothetical protein